MLHWRFACLRRRFGRPLGKLNRPTIHRFGLSHLRFECLRPRFRRPLGKLNMPTIHRIGLLHWRFAGFWGNDLAKIESAVYWQLTVR